MGKKCLIVFNPKSGDTDFGTPELMEMADLNLPSFSLSLFETTGGDDSAKIITLYEEFQPDLVLIAGGDGTIKMVAKFLEDKDCPLGILPFGSANGLAKCMGINGVPDAWEAMREYKIHGVDAIQINGELCLHLADFGINANMIRKFEQDDTRGMLGYVKHSLSEIFGSESKKFLLKTGEETIEIEAKMIVIANGDQYGTGAKINCGGLMDDGKFEIIALNPQAADDYLRMTIEFFRGDLHDDPACQTWRLETCEIINLEGAVFQIDGEMFGKPDSVQVQIEKHKYKFITGKSFATCQLPS